jgi:hypothetical protein
MAIFNLPMATLTDLDAPVITGTTVGTSTTIREDTGVDSYLTTFLTASPVASFAIVSNPGNLFAIAVNGGLTVSGALDYETASSHTLTITATDFVGLTSSPFTFTVNVLDLDENPPVLTLDTSATNLTQIDEYISQATLVATFDVVDNDTSSGRVATTSTPATTLAREFIPYITIGGETVPLSTIASVAETADITLSGDPGAQNFYTEWDFISSTNGKVKIYASEGGALAGGVTGDTDVTLTVGISDEAGNYGYANYTVTVIETPDPAVFVPAVLKNRTNTFNLQENTPNGQGQINQYEATGTVPHNWSVHGADADKFTVSSSGALSLVDPLDYEAQSSYSFTVRVTNYFYGPDGEIDQTYFDEEDCALTVINDTTDDPLNVEIGSNMDGVMHEDRIRSAGNPLGAIGGRLFTACTNVYGGDDAFTNSVFCEIDPTTGDLTVIKQLPTGDVDFVTDHMITRGSELWARYFNLSSPNDGLIALSRNGGFNLRAMLYDQTIDRDDQTNGRFWSEGSFLDPEDQNFWGYYKSDSTWMNIDTRGRKVGSLRYKNYRPSTPEQDPDGEGIAVGPYFYTSSFDPDDNRSNLNCYIRPTAQTLNDGTAFDFVGHARVRFPFSTDNGYVQGMAVIGTTLYLTARSTNLRARLASFNLPNPNDPLATLTGV